MVKIYYVNGNPAPVCVCDWCNKIITDVDLGAVVFPGYTGKDWLVELRHVHRETCQRKIMIQTGWTGWQSLAAHLVCLKHNTRLPGEKDHDEELGDVPIGDWASETEMD